MSLYFLPAAVRRLALLGGIATLGIISAAFAKAQNPATPPPLADATILIIRHAEKPENGAGLNPQGERRAAVYPDYFRGFLLEGKPLKIDALFAAADSKGSQRSRLTLEPLAKTLGLEIAQPFKAEETKELAEELRTKDHGKCILICWHHGPMRDLLRELGANPAKLLPNSEWPDDVFNWVIALRFDAEGRLVPKRSQRLKERWAQ